MPDTNFAALSGADTIVIGGNLLVDLMDGDVGTIEFPNDLVTVKAGKDGNTAFAMNAAGRMAQMKLRVVLGGPSDALFTSWMNWIEQDFASFALLSGTIVKRVGNGISGMAMVTYVLSAGVIKKKPAMTNNVEGNTDQAVPVWEFTFAHAIRLVA